MYSLDTDILIYYAINDNSRLRLLADKIQSLKLVAKWIIMGTFGNNYMRNLSKIIKCAI